MLILVSTNPWVGYSQQEAATQLPPPPKIPTLGQVTMIPPVYDRRNKVTLALDGSASLLLGSALSKDTSPQTPSRLPPLMSESVETDHKVEDAPCRNQAKRGRRTYGIRQVESDILKRYPPDHSKNDPATGSRVELLESTSDDADWVRACLDKVGFMPEHVKTVQGIGEAPISEEVFMGELDQLLSAAGDDDVVVIFISMHSIRIQGSGEIFLVLEGKYGCPTLVRELNSKLGNVRCTVEVILDVCYAGGLIACPHVIYEMKSASDSTIIVTTTGKNYIKCRGASSLSQLGSQPRREPNASAACAGQPPAKSKHVIHGVASDSCFRVRLKARNVNAIVQGSPVGEELNTPSDIIIWAAAKKDQQTYECVSDEYCNGALTTGIAEQLAHAPGPYLGEIFSKARLCACCVD
ncbi:hypothetical protein RhiJN_11971 [Ceratobasidium sp. AG-Ba]|nr:hypothetical protein RhiJN_11971 [Ceratobasidium sp. AG-Ba]